MDRRVEALFCPVVGVYLRVLVPLWTVDLQPCGACGGRDGR